MRKFITGLAVVLAANPAFAQEINVTGRGEVSVAPDMARISLGVTREDESAAKALDAMSVQLERVIAELSAAGIEGSDIQTSSVRLDLRQDYNSTSGVNRITGHIASSDVQITVNDLSGLGAVLDAVAEAGATQMNGLQFDVSDRDTHLDEARRLAVVDARAKATLFAQAADVTLGSLIELSESGAAPTHYQAEAAFSRSASVPIAPGEIDIFATITMRYTAE